MTPGFLPLALLGSTAVVTTAIGGFLCYRGHAFVGVPVLFLALVLVDFFRNRAIRIAAARNDKDRDRRED
ncbi:hypothetical protein [Marilutibacter chinensis]|uniref:Uncharacterized protein n=1 Tax=Marilutibacter chinensis TaxID=2912247 RepID=A0ABS9HQ56_9GAMM|nr:hypothetical protein [Lysobacter chinensis]MCF7221079.1 hypothetical protein [Lysobacter chinensis]